MELYVAMTTQNANNITVLSPCPVHSVNSHSFVKACQMIFMIYSGILITDLFNAATYHSAQQVQEEFRQHCYMVYFNFTIELY